MIDALDVPGEATVGEPVAVRVAARDPEGLPVTVRWSATSGRFDDPAAADTLWTPTRTGLAELAVTVRDAAGGETASDPTPVAVSPRDGCSDEDGDGHGQGAGCVDWDCDDGEPGA